VRPKQKKAKKSVAKVESPDVSSDDDPDFTVTKLSHRSAAKPKSPSPSISSDSSESALSLSDSDSKSSTENNNRVGVISHFELVIL